MSQRSRSARLDTVCGHITDGKHGDCSDEPGSGYYFLSCKDVAGGKLNYDGAREIAEADFVDTHRRTCLEPLDILITNSGTIGRMAIAPDHPNTQRTTFQKSVAILKPLRQIVDPRFLYYRLLADMPRLRDFAGGTAQKNLLLRDLRAFEIELPSLDSQRMLAAVLSAYDDLIENNTRRIQVLEKMAQAIYREWFVNFRFPGHEKVKRVDSPMGKIPQGWRAARLAEAVEIERAGITPASFPDEEFQHFSIPAFDAGMRPAIEQGRTILSAKHLLEPGCVLLSKLNPRIPRVWLATPRGERRAITSTEFLVLRPKPAVTREFVYETCVSAGFADRLAGLAIGTSTSHQRVKPESLLEMLVVVPDRKVDAQFSAMVAPMLGAVESLRVKCQNLRFTRDLLLPKLISGALDVSKMAIETP